MSWRLAAWIRERIANTMAKHANDIASVREVPMRQTAHELEQTLITTHDKDLDGRRQLQNAGAETDHHSTVPRDPDTSDQRRSTLSVPAWKWDEKNVIRRWDDAVAVYPNNPVVEGHVMVVAIGPSGASVDKRMVYAAELARTMSSANIITSRRGLNSDFGPMHVIPREFGDGLPLWAEGHEAHPLRPLTKENCVFDRIVEGRAPATILRRWKDAIAIVPLNPIAEGKHQLIMPTEHIPNAAADPQAAGAMMAHVVEQTRHMENVDMVTSKGGPATQTIDHEHLHALEREEGDGFVCMTNG
ncbi:HIT domain-containing protein [Nocardia asteroides]|nr:HIT domain-containing protein [Nocardia asteroides]